MKRSSRLDSRMIAATVAASIRAPGSTARAAARRTTWSSRGSRLVLPVPAARAASQHDQRDEQQHEHGRDAQRPCRVTQSVLVTWPVLRSSGSTVSNSLSTPLSSTTAMSPRASRSLSVSTGGSPDARYTMPLAAPELATLSTATRLSPDTSISFSPLRDVSVRRWEKTPPGSSRRRARRPPRGTGRPAPPARRRA